MMGTWKTFTPRQKAVTEKAFEALSTLDALTEWGEAGGEKPRQIGFSDLFAYVTGPERAMDGELRRALGRDARLGVALDRLLDKVSLYHIPRLAAASSGLVESREGEGFRIRLRPSRSVASQTYVIIELFDPLAEPPKTMFLCTSSNQYGKYPLPAAQDGIIQILAETDSELVKSLGEVDTEVFLH